jgi:hypothetical protein
MLARTVSVNDRIRAKPPATDEGRWWPGTVEVVTFDDHEQRYAVQVAPEDSDDTVTVRVSEAVYDLFTGRLDADDPVDERVWVK